MDSITATVSQPEPLSTPAPRTRRTVPSLALLRPGDPPKIPAYLHEIYYWAYLNPRNVRWLDHEWVVRLILWQQHKRLRNAVFAEVEPGHEVLQSTCVYGDYLPLLAAHVGGRGHLAVADVAEVQLRSAHRKLHQFQHVSLHHANVLDLDCGRYDTVICYFLLHELPDQDKRLALDALLARVRPGGKAVFIDYHKPHWAHPLKPITSLVFETLEPFAKGMWRHEVADFAGRAGAFHWRKERYFGGLFQKVVACRREHPAPGQP